MISGLHRHLDPVTMPDGTVVWAASWHDHHERGHVPEFGLYLDLRWQPPWPHAHVDWPDFGLPADPDGLSVALRDLLDRARAGATVEVGCLGGHGRTGTTLGCLAVLAGVTQDPVEWVRDGYCDHAIETEAQARFVRSFVDRG